jgi:hypothetical protein
MSTIPPISREQPVYESAGFYEAIILLRGLTGAIFGGLAGYVLFAWLYQNGFYAIMVPGALLGIGAGLVAGGRSHWLPVICLALGIGLTLFSEWHVCYSRTWGLVFFVTNFFRLLPPVKLIMMTLGAACAYWFGHGR